MDNQCRETLLLLQGDWWSSPWPECAETILTGWAGIRHRTLLLPSDGKVSQVECSKGTKQGYISTDWTVEWHSCAASLGLVDNAVGLKCTVKLVCSWKWELGSVYMANTVLSSCNIILSFCQFGISFWKYTNLIGSWRVMSLSIDPAQIMSPTIYTFQLLTPSDFPITKPTKNWLRKSRNKLIHVIFLRFKSKWFNL